MEQSSQNLRKELRYPLGTQAILERHTGEQFNAATINVSASGMLVQLEHTPDLRLAEELSCSVVLYQGKPPQSWGLGRGVRVEDLRVAIEFKNVSLLGADSNNYTSGHHRFGHRSFPRPVLSSAFSCAFSTSPPSPLI